MKGNGFGCSDMMKSCLSGTRRTERVLLRTPVTGNSGGKTVPRTRIKTEKLASQVMRLVRCEKKNGRASRR